MQILTKTKILLLILLFISQNACLYIQYPHKHSKHSHWNQHNKQIDQEHIKKYNHRWLFEDVQMWDQNVIQKFGIGTVEPYNISHVSVFQPIGSNPNANFTVVSTSNPTTGVSATPNAMPVTSVDGSSGATPQFNTMNTEQNTLVPVTAVSPLGQPIKGFIPIFKSCAH